MGEVGTPRRAVHAPQVVHRPSRAPISSGELSQSDAARAIIARLGSRHAARVVASRSHSRQMSMASSDLLSAPAAVSVATAPHQRLQHPGRHGQRLWQPDREPRPPAVHLPDGGAGLGQESLPVQHRRLADLVHHPGQQARLHRAQEGNRLPRGDEPGDRTRGRALARAGVRRRLRRDAEAGAAAHRSSVLSRCPSTRSSRRSARTRACGVSSAT